MSDLTVRISGDSSGAIKAMADVSGAARDFSNEIVAKLAEVTAAAFSFDKALGAIKEGIRFSDEVRDLSLSLDVFTGSVAKGTQAMDFFRANAERTRDTAVELGRAFRDILPTAEARGFSQSATEDVTVMLSQLATERGTDLSTMEAGFRRLLSGSAQAGKNPLMAALGFTKENVDLSWKQVIDALIDKTKDFDEFGQSFESSTKKIKDAWLDAFGEGFNETTGNARKGLDGIREVLTDPKLTGAIEDIGKHVGEAVGWFHDIGDRATYIKSQWNELANSPGGKLLGFMFQFNLAALTSKEVGLIGQGLDWLTKPPDPSGGGGAGGWGGFSGTSGGWDEGPEARKKRLEEEAEARGRVVKALQDEKEIRESFKTAWQMRGLPGFDNSQLGNLLTPTGWGPGFTEGLPPGSMTFPNGINGGFNYGQMLPFSNMAGLGGMERVGNLFGQIGSDPTKSFAEKFMDALNDGFRSETFRSSLSDAFVDLFSTGGKNVGQIFASALRQNMASELDSIFKAIPLAQKDPSKAGTLFYDASGNRTSFGTGVGDATIGVESGFAGYSAGMSGTPGSRTGSIVGGVAAGAEVGGIYGAIIGGVLAAIGGALGASARQADYQYGVPDIKDGIATLGNSKNLTPGAVTQITTQIQQEYDAIHSGLIDLLLKFPDLAIPSFDEINGKFQDNPSAHWGEHLQQWITGTLPKEIIAALGDELAKGFGQYGMSKDAFSGIFKFLQNGDPQQAIQQLSQLADALKTLFGVLPGNQSSINDFFHGTIASSWFAPGSPNSTTFQTGWSQIQNQNRMSPGQLIGGQYDSQIEKDAAALTAGGLSPSEQIKYISEIASLSKQRYDAEKQAIQQIFDVAQGLGRTADQLISQYTVQGMVGADGKPDSQRIVDYYTGKSNQDLLRIRNASNATDLDYWTRQFYGDIGATQQAGIQGGGNVQEWSKWAADQIKAGNALAQAQLQAIGQTINTTNDLLNKQLDPALQAFLDGVTLINGVIGGGGDKGGGDLPGNLKEIADGAGAASDAIAQMTANIIAFNSAMAKMGYSAAVRGSRQQVA